MKYDSFPFFFSPSPTKKKNHKKKMSKSCQTALMSFNHASIHESSIDTFQFSLGTCQARDDPRIINASFRCAQERRREENGAHFDVQFVCSTRDRRVKLNPPFLLYVPPFAPPRYNITQSRHVRRPKRIGLRARTKTAKIPGSLDR